MIFNLGSIARLSSFIKILSSIKEKINILHCCSHYSFFWIEICSHVVHRDGRTERRMKFLPFLCQLSPCNHFSWKYASISMKYEQHAQQESFLFMYLNHVSRLLVLFHIESIFLYSHVLSRQEIGIINSYRNEFRVAWDLKWRQMLLPHWQFKQRDKQSETKSKPHTHTHYLSSPLTPLFLSFLLLLAQGRVFFQHTSTTRTWVESHFLNMWGTMYVDVTVDENFAERVWESVPAHVQVCERLIA